MIILPSAALIDIPVECFVPADFQVSYCASATVFAWLREQRAQRQLATDGVLALGDPVFTTTSAPPTSQRGLQAVAALPGLGQKPMPVASDAPTNSVASWSSLPGTRLEVEQLQRLAQQRDLTSTVWLGSDASEQALYQLQQAGTLAKFRYLHFATHGLTNDRFPLQSKLILSRDRLPDPIQQLEANLPVFHGELTAEMILRDWDLNAELAVLSACQSGLGQFNHSEGYLGLSQPLLLAGARSVVVSLWNVEDTATQLFMCRFYENLWGLRDGDTAQSMQPMSKVAALHEAKQWLRSLDQITVEQQVRQRGLQLQLTERTGATTLPFAHPTFWTAFVLIGDWE